MRQKKKWQAKKAQYEKAGFTRLHFAAAFGHVEDIRSWSNKHDPDYG